jgi:hypothetical protein
MVSVKLIKDISPNHKVGEVHQFLPDFANKMVKFGFAEFIEQKQKKEPKEQK